MSAISVLGFTPSSFSSSSSSSPSSSIHWAILISPHPPQTIKAQKPKSRFFHAKITTKEPQPESVLFDMHNHQLRQQPFPIPLKEEPTPPAETSTATNQTTTTPTSSHPVSPTLTPQSTGTSTASDPITITTLNADSPHPLQLTIRILGSILPQHPPSKLIPRLSQRLYTTPTYGPEDDWLRDALSAMYASARGGSGPLLLDPGFDVDKFVEYAGEAAKEYALYEPESVLGDGGNGAVRSQEKAVLELDYAAHIARNAEVKAMLSHQQHYQHSSTLSQSPHDLAPAQEKQTRRGWLGFRVSTSPGQRVRRPIERHSFERQDDPYGGLM